MLLAVVVLDLIAAEGSPTAWNPCAGSVVAVLLTGVLVGELEVSLEVGVAGEGVDGAAWDVARVAALAFDRERLGFLAAGIVFCGEIAWLQLIIGFVFRDNEVIVHVP